LESTDSKFFNSTLTEKLNGCNLETGPVSITGVRRTHTTNSARFTFSPNNVNIDWNSAALRSTSSDLYFGKCFAGAEESPSSYDFEGPEDHIGNLFLSCSYHFE
ncbi:hypothetical protein CCH79_00006635, partial [Gambusia affinis]